eukprot:INCI9273.2.p1 GENE.INCI9273.2~~INCI9273.2.p1  ORF type:complete len:395 (-),score=60.50 INCI9273.2:58-1242(-)
MSSLLQIISRARPLLGPAAAAAAAAPRWAGPAATVGKYKYAAQRAHYHSLRKQPINARVGALRRRVFSDISKPPPTPKTVSARPSSLWRRFNERVERIPKRVRVGFRIVRVGFYCVTIYQLGKAEGMAEYATNPAAYAQGITAQVVSQFAPPGTDPASVVVNGPTEQRVIRIMRKVVEGAAKTLKRLHAEAKDPEEKVRLERAMEMLQRRWTVVVIDNDAVNAFVHPLLPGATFFLTGLVGPAADYTDEEIAMVCAHELSHALFEHGREALATQGILTALKVVVLTALDPTGVLSLVIEAVLNPFVSLSLELPHSRTHESEADSLGIQIVADSCFDLEKACNFFSKLDDLHDGSAAWASTHPHPKDRHEALAEMVADPVLMGLNAECEVHTALF